MRKTLVVTDVTRMGGDRVCVAGIDERGNCVRPVTPGDVREHHLYQGQQVVIHPKAKVEFELSSANIDPPHIEDEQFTPNAIVRKGICSDEEWGAILEGSCFPGVSDVFGGHLLEGRYVLPEARTRSLGTIRDVRINYVAIETYYEKRRLRLDFTDQRNQRYSRLPINDLTFRAYVQSSITKVGNLKTENVAQQALLGADRIYLRIGLARPWSRQGSPRACWTQVTGIYTFPDYLEGKTFADFS